MVPNAGREQKQKFYNMSLAERHRWLKETQHLDDETISTLSGETGLKVEQADHMIENVVGVFALPLGIAQNFIINGREVLVPMALEEPSVVASASFMAKLACASGGFVAETTAPEMIAQIQVLNLENLDAAKQKILDAKQDLLEKAGKVDPVLSKYGGGPRDIQVRLMEDTPIGPFMVVHLIFDVRDAMGANAVNTAAETLAPQIEALTGGKVHLRIL